MNEKMQRAITIGFVAVLAIGLGSLIWYIYKQMNLPREREAKYSNYYNWNAKLAEQNGDLDFFVKDLPLGHLEALESYNLFRPRNNGSTISNIKALSAFIARQADAGAAAIGCYKEEGTKLYSFAYLALLPPNTELNKTIEKRESSSPDFLSGGANIMVEWDKNQINIDMLKNCDCQFYYAKSSVTNLRSTQLNSVFSSLEGHFDYLTLAGFKENLYFEIAVPINERLDSLEQKSSFLRSSPVQKIMEVCKSLNLDLCSDIVEKTSSLALPALMEKSQN
jgi:hypothetical protein